MSLRILSGFILLLFWASAQATIHHQLEVDVSPADSRIEVTDTLTLPADFIKAQQSFDFVLHKQLTLEQNTNIEKLDSDNPHSHLQRYRVSNIPESGKIKLSYRGQIKHDLAQPEEESARSFRSTLGIISPTGVFLDSSAAWYPYIADELVSFELSISIPSPWQALSAGKNTDESNTQNINHVTWVEPLPQDNIYLIAAPFTRYKQQAGNVELQVYLRKDEPSLAQQYLDIGAQYMAMYQKFLGRYPYEKFAVVENFWETGFGMPSFTLLGPRVMRFPFILHSSYPHEILHNWWGNGVFVDYETGNWAEGLTAYLADHLIAEQRGNAVNHRRNTLQSYNDYVSEGRDFPLNQFRSRHDSASAAVGYGKALMLFHMLRVQLGDEVFSQGLRQLYKKLRFNKASFKDLENIFSETSDKNLSLFFSQWVERTGAPSLKLSKVEEFNTQLTIEIEQTQDSTPYTLLVPIVIEFLDGQQKQLTLPLSKRRQRFELEISASVGRVIVDPEFDIFRRLDPREIPSALSQGFGASDTLAILPSTADEELLNAYQDLINTWQQTQKTQFTIIMDDELEQLPSNKTSWILGWENQFRDTLAEQIKGHNSFFEDDRLHIAGEDYQRGEHSLVVTARHPQNAAQTMLWLSSDNTQAIRGLARKLPHYGKYSHLAFSGDAPNNIGKDQWSVHQSPLVKTLTQESLPPLKLKPRPALATLAPVFSEQRMLADISHLADETLKGRGLGSKELDLAANYIANEFKSAGLKPFDKDYFQTWQTSVKDLGDNIQLKNVIGVIPGTNSKYTGESVVVTAHYDHLGLGWPDVRQGNAGKTHHGADDNASGVAVMLELARILGKGWKPERSIVFIAFTAEEAGLLGSSYYVNNSKPFAIEKTMGVLNIDAVGRLEDKPISVFGIDSASEWVHIFRGVGFVTGIKLKTNDRAFGASDHVNFHEMGVPGVQFFSGIHLDYHRPSDTSDKIDGAGLVKVASVVRETLDYLAKRPEPLNAQLGRIKLPDGSQTNTRQGRKVSIGTVPDFDYSGQGARLSDIVTGSPAAEAGLKAGDIIIAIDSKTVDSLREYAKILRETQAGDTLSIKVLRDNVTKDIEVTAITR